MKEENIFNLIKFNDKGLICAIAQDFQSNEVLMMAFMNKESIKITLETGFVCYFSRSRNKLWKKGETSGQLQELQEMLLDCDGDAILLRVKQLGQPVGVACHTGRKSCFFNKVDKNGNISINQKILVKQEDLYGKK